MVLTRTILAVLPGILRKWGKMVFLSGPRQVGKTTLAKALLEELGGGIYFNWDLITHRRRLARDPYFFEREPGKPGQRPLLVFDEIHKYSRWKSYLKGVYDGFHDSFDILVTGSGRLDIYKKGGESLLGRYVGIPLFPFTVGELLGRRPTWNQFARSFEASSGAAVEESANALPIFDRLLRFGGFPEPYLKNDPEFYRVWSATRTQLLVREDIRDATNIRQISLLETLVHLLEPRIGAPLSINSLREDLGVAFETVREWLDVLSNFYYFFRVAPYAKRIARALKKESKIYFYDWGEIQSDGARFENAVALHLLKAVKLWTALGETAAELYYVRDKEKREVDFLIVADRKPCVLVECKLSDTQPSPHLLYYQEKLEVPLALQLVHQKGIDEEWRRGRRRQRVISADRWLAGLP
jgi:predicted AAA+ superfamily ATPase